MRRQLEDVAVAKKKKVTGGQEPDPAKKFEAALKALEGKRHFQFVGGMDKDGNAKFDLNELEELKKKLKSARINLGTVKFVALNAPFMRRSPTRLS